MLAVKLNADWVVRMSEQRGSIETGKRADLVLLDGPADHMPYRFGHNPVEVVLIAGEPAYVRPGSEWRLGGLSRPPTRDGGPPGLGGAGAARPAPPGLAGPPGPRAGGGGFPHKAA